MTIEQEKPNQGNLTETDLREIKKRYGRSMAEWVKSLTLIDPGAKLKIYSGWTDNTQVDLHHEMAVSFQAENPQVPSLFYCLEDGQPVALLTPDSNFFSVQGLLPPINSTLPEGQLLNKLCFSAKVQRDLEEIYTRYRLEEEQTFQDLKVRYYRHGNLHQGSPQGLVLTHDGIEIPFFHSAAQIGRQLFTQPDKELDEKHLALFVFYETEVKKLEKTREIVGQLQEALFLLGYDSQRALHKKIIESDSETNVNYIFIPSELEISHFRHFA
ncbi:MAG: hypothetical protein M1514_02915 [Patescibacteria group bacterium]|nr:hypothetical protein [Patescibacteria group bacterium]